MAFVHHQKKHVAYILSPDYDYGKQSFSQQYTSVHSSWPKKAHQFNTTIYGLDDRYRGSNNERRVVFMNADDIRDLGLAAGQTVDLTSYFHGQTRVARHFLVVRYDIPRRCAATYFPETNVLVPLDSVAETSNTPTSKYVIIRVTLCVG